MILVAEDGTFPGSHLHVRSSFSDVVFRHSWIEMLKFPLFVIIHVASKLLKLLVYSLAILWASLEQDELEAHSDLECTVEE